jgi:hypothetical protein
MEEEVNLQDVAKKNMFSQLMSWALIVPRVLAIPFESLMTHCLGRGLDGCPQLMWKM